MLGIPLRELESNRVRALNKIHPITRVVYIYTHMCSSPFSSPSPPPTPPPQPSPPPPPSPCHLSGRCALYSCLAAISKDHTQLDRIEFTLPCVQGHNSPTSKRWRPIVCVDSHRCNISLHGCTQRDHVFQKKACTVWRHSHGSTFATAHTEHTAPTAYTAHLTHIAHTKQTAHTAHTALTAQAAASRRTLHWKKEKHPTHRHTLTHTHTYARTLEIHTGCVLTC